MKLKAARSFLAKIVVYFRDSWTPTLIIAIVVVFAFTHQTLRLVHLQDWLDHTDQAIGKGLLVQKLILDAETGIRGFLLTDDPSMLAPYHTQNALFDSTLHEARAFVEDNVVQEKRLTKLSQAFTDWRNEAERLIRHEVTGPRARSYFGNGAGRDIIDRCRHLIDEFLEEE